MKDEEEYDQYSLSDEGRDLCALWAVKLYDAGYDLSKDLGIWDAAGYLIAQDIHEDLSIEQVALLLVFISKVWDKLTEGFREQDESS